jgi:protoporphyrinogen oxidase
VFWQPLLKAKFGPFHDQVAAVFIWATLTRLFGARTAGAGRENLGYVRGGYKTVLAAFGRALRDQGVAIRLRTEVKSIRAPFTGATPGAAAEPSGCRVAVSAGGGPEAWEEYDQVFFTGPTAAAERVAGEELLPYVRRMARAYPTSEAYLGVVCLVLVLKRPLTPYYVLNIGEDLGLTGLIEMTNLIDAGEETKGRGLVYLPRYLDSADPRLAEPDGEVYRGLVQGGLKRLFPGFDEADIVSWSVQRTRYVQPLPLARAAAGAQAEILPAPEWERPFQILNTSMLRCATLNNNEVVGLAEEFLGRNAGRV